MITESVNQATQNYFGIKPAKYRTDTEKLRYIFLFELWTIVAITLYN